MVTAKEVLISALIEGAIMEEAEARKHYLELLPHLLDPSDIDVVEHIIADELNHTELLKALAFKYNKIVELKH